MRLERKRVRTHAIPGRKFPKRAGQLRSSPPFIEKKEEGMARRSIKARLKETPWMVVLILFLILIVIVAMWGKLPWRGRPTAKPPLQNPLGSMDKFPARAGVLQNLRPVAN
jgi:hypothetical protein